MLHTRAIHGYPWNSSLKKFFLLENYFLMITASFEKPVSFRWNFLQKTTFILRQYEDKARLFLENIWYLFPKVQKWTKQFSFHTYYSKSNKNPKVHRRRFCLDVFIDVGYSETVLWNAANACNNHSQNKHRVVKTVATCVRVVFTVRSPAKSRQISRA